MNKEKFHVAYVTDDNYAMPTCVSIISLIQNKRPEVKYCVHIVTDNVTEQNKDYLKKLDSPDCEIDIVDADNSFYREIQYGSLNKNTHVKPTALFKFNLPVMFPDVETILYLDSDIIIIKDISDFFEMDISSYCAAVVQAMGMIVHHLHQGLRYFASSVMLFNLNKMREENMTEKLVEYKKNDITYVMDNDGFCVVLENKVLFLPYTYNFNTFIFATQKFDNFNKKFFNGKYVDEYDCLMDQKILHMQGRQKPWQYYFPWLTDFFLKYYEMSPYKDKPLKFTSSAIQVAIDNISRLDNKKEWRFPRDKIPKGSRVILYGAGEIGRTFYNFLKDTDYGEVTLWVDKNYEKINKEFNKKDLVHSPKDIEGFQAYDFIVITFFRQAMSIVTNMQLKDIGVPEEKIVAI